MKTIQIKDKKNTRMIAHRGLSGIERENSVSAFVAAGNRDYYGIECDVHVTKDGKYVIYHDDTTGRLCEKDLRIEETDYEELARLRLLQAEKQRGMIAFIRFLRCKNILKFARAIIKLQ